VDLLQLLLPSPNTFHLESWTLDAAHHQIVLRVSSTQRVACCPRCHCLTQRIHSRYERILKDLPWASFGLTIQLQVHKFFCLNRGCPRRIFTERLAQVAIPWARQTVRLSGLLRALGLALGGAAAARLSEQIHCHSSRNTLLRNLAKLPFAPISPAKIVGVDDFAFRKGQHYGTILVDLEQHQPIALLPDRKAATLAKWLVTHPGVQVISRDRAAAYKQGASQGAPTAMQVVDRFHLLQNLTEVLTEVFQQQSQAIKAAQASLDAVSSPSATVGSTPPVGVLPPPEREPADEVHAQQVRARRFATYQQVWQLYQQGKPQKTIAQQLGIGVKTVYRYLHRPTFPEWSERQDRGRSALDPFQERILKRWNQGCHEGKQIYQDLLSWGCPTSYSSVARYCRRLRQAQGLSKRQHRAVPGVTPLPEVQRRPLTPRKAAWLILTRAEHRQANDEHCLSALQAHSSALSEAITLGQTFVEMVRNRQSQSLDPWLTQSSTSTLGAFVRFAKGLREDYDAVKAALDFPWSNGPVEGQINRLKMLKRQMYGQAGLPLLTQRFLRTA
jgi:transposase